MKRLFSAVLLFWAMIAAAQTPPASEVYHMNRLMLYVLDDYVRTGTLSTEEDVRTFLSLFDRPAENCLVNDIVGSAGYKSVMSPENYVLSFGADKGSQLICDISKVRKAGDYYQQDGRWHRTITFYKQVLFIDSSSYSEDAGGVFYDTRQLYSESGGSLYLALDMVYVPESDRCLISRIDFAEPIPASVVDRDHFVVVLKPDSDLGDGVLHGDAPISYNDYGQAFLDSRDLAYSTEDYAVRPLLQASSDRYGVYSLQFKKLHHFRFKPRYSMSLNSSFGLAAHPESVNFDASSSSMEAGLDVGLLFGSGNRVRTGLYSGAAYSSSKINMTAGGFSYEFLPGINYQVSSASESLAFTDIMIPLYLEMEFMLGRWLNLSLDLGGKFYIAQNTSILSPYQVSGSVGGSSFNLDASRSGLLDPGYYGKQPYDLSFFGNIEFDVRVLKKILYLFASAGYEYGLQGLLPIYAPETVRTWFSSSGSFPVFPVVSGGGENYLFRSLSQSVAFHRQGVWISFGLKIKMNI